MIVSDMALLEALPGKLKALSTMRAKVGVLEATNARTRSTTAEDVAHIGSLLKPSEIPKTREAKETNAEIGLRHELGTFGPRWPRRSFLEDPMSLRGAEGIEAHAVPELIEDMALGTAAPKDLVERLAVAAESVIDGAFESGGYGLWPQLSARTIDAKQHDQILVESGQLRESITHEIEAAPGA